MLHSRNCRTALRVCQRCGTAISDLETRLDLFGTGRRADPGVCEHGPMSRRHRTVFRLPLMALIFPVLLLLCTIPLAGLGSWWNLMYLVPVLAMLWAVMTRTATDATGIRVFGLLRRRSIAWDQIDRLELDGPRWIVLVTRAGTRTRLPMVLTRDLPRLTARSGGAITFDDQLLTSAGPVTTVSPVAPAGPAPDSDPQA